MDIRDTLDYAAKCLFGVILRVMGLYVLGITVWTSGLMLFGPVPFGFMTFVLNVVGILAGVWLLKGAPLLSDTAYPDRTPRPAPSYPPAGKPGDRMGGDVAPPGYQD